MRAYATDRFTDTEGQNGRSVSSRLGVAALNAMMLAPAMAAILPQTPRTSP